MTAWRKALLDDVREGILAAIPIVAIEPGEGDDFFVYWPANGSYVQVYIPPQARSPCQLPSAEQAIMQAVESLMLRAPIAGRG
jgi:hypothetical protein